MRNTIIEKIKRATEPVVFRSSGGFSGVIVKTNNGVIVKLPEDEFFNTENKYPYNKIEELISDYSIVEICELFNDCTDEDMGITNEELEKIKSDIETHFEEENLSKLLEEQNTFEKVEVTIPDNSKNEFWKKIRVIITPKIKKDKKIIFEIIYEPFYGSGYADWKIENKNEIEYITDPIKIMDDILENENNKEKEKILRILKIIEDAPF